VSHISTYFAKHHSGLDFIFLFKKEKESTKSFAKKSGKYFLEGFLKQNRD